MKIHFTPINPPAPVRPGDMPEGVAFEYLFGASVRIGVRMRAYIMAATDDNNALPDNCASVPTDHRLVGQVLRRRDGQPLPSAEGEPVPLDTLEPWPMFFQRPDSGRWSAHDGEGGVFTYCDLWDVPVAFYSDAIGNVSVLPTPYIMEVQP